MATNAAVATLWSGKLIENLNDAHVYRNMTNDDYEGEISGKGDALKIFSIGRPNINVYTPGTTTISYQRLRPTPQILVIDQDDYWAITEDKLEALLARTKTMERLMKEAAWGFADTVDTHLASAMQAGAGVTMAARTVGTGAFSSNAYELLVDMGIELDENNVPSDGRGVAVPHWFYGMLKKDKRFVDYGTPENRAVIRGAPVGEVNDFTVYRSNNVPLSGTTYTVIAAWKGATTYGEHMDGNGIEILEKMENNFDKSARARLVFGSKVTQPNGIVTVDITQGS